MCVGKILYRSFTSSTRNINQMIIFVVFFVVIFYYYFLQFFSLSYSITSSSLPCFSCCLRSMNNSLWFPNYMWSNRFYLFFVIFIYSIYTQTFHFGMENCRKIFGFFLYLWVTNVIQSNIYYYNVSLLLVIYVKWIKYLCSGYFRKRIFVISSFAMF